MKYQSVIAILVCMTSLLATQGCKQTIQLEYGKVHAQFESSTIAKQGTPFLKKKVTVRGKITERNLNESTGRITMVLDDLVHAVWYGNERTPDDVILTTDRYQVGQVVYLDGFLISCDEDKVVLDPVHSRDSSAPFDPIDK